MGRVEANAVHCAEADTRGRTDRPAGFGVVGMRSAFTPWNRWADGSVVLTVRRENLSAGSAGSPVSGGGLFVDAHGNTARFSDGRTVELERLSTGDVFSTEAWRRDPGFDRPRRPHCWRRPDQTGAQPRNDPQPREGDMTPGNRGEVASWTAASCRN